MILNNYIITLSMYFLSYLGYLLGIVTKDEHKQIQKKLDNIVFYTYILFYITLAIILISLQKFSILLLLLSIIILNIYKKEHSDTLKMILFTILFSILYSNDIFYPILGIIVILFMFEKSTKIFNPKKELYNIITLSITFAIITTLQLIF